MRRPRLGHRLIRAVVAALIILAAATMTWVLVWTEIQTGATIAEPELFAIFAALLIICERWRATWITFEPMGVVTPSIMFSFALVLLGSPSLAVGIALAGATLHALATADPAQTMIVRVGGTALSLSTGGLVLAAMGVDGPITQPERVPWEWAIALIAAGLSILLLNALVASIWIAARRRISFLTILRRGLAARITAEGAFLSLAPIWVIATDFSLVLAPLLGITTVLVFRAARQALERNHEAMLDPLTGLPNRRAFLAQVDDDLLDAHGGNRPVVLVMDLDGFKDINDRLGHQVGDLLLVAFAETLESRLPADASAARLGGDEFAVRLLTAAADDGLDAMVQRLHRSLGAPLDIEGFPVTVGVSMGVAIGSQDGHTTIDLLRAADVAMYRAKRTRASVEYYGNCVQAPQRGRLNLLSHLTDALDEHQFIINYQPQIRVTDGGVDAVEALVRWQHPEYGVIPPGEFIGLAEHTDLIGPITERVLRLSTQGLMTGRVVDLRLAVNVSARSLQDPNFADSVFGVLAESGFDPRRLELEVTERALVSNAERSIYTLDQLRGAGVRIAIDDFGVGYSSYQTLRTLDVDRVKIDRDFIQELLTHPKDRTIVSSLIRLAHTLGLDVVAEGVESTPVWNALAELRCDVAQGYGIAVPMAYPDLRAWLDDWSRVISAERSLVAGT